MTASISRRSTKKSKRAMARRHRKQTLTTQQYMDLICCAISRVGADYFNLKTTYEPSGIVRERAFCYELYHQIRLCMPEENQVSLNGEIDKRGHRDFDIGDQKNPDFVFHIPGTHKGNTIVIEVKGKVGGIAEKIIEDIKKLLLFTEKYQYQCGIFLLYNHNLDELLEVLDDGLEALENRATLDRIYLIIAPSPTEEPSIYKLSKIIKTKFSRSISG